MSEFDRQNASRSPRMRRAGLAALGVLIVGGGAFAATGGVERIRSWFVTVQIGDQVHNVELVPTGDGSGAAQFTATTPDGRTANLQIVRSGNDDGSEQTQVNVNVDSDNTQERQIVKIRTGNGPGPVEPEQQYTLADLNGAQPSHSWTDADGIPHSVHLVPDAGGNRRAFMVSQGANGPEVRLLLTINSEIASAEEQPTITVLDNGAISFRFDDGNGRVRELRAKCVSRSETVTAPRVLNLGADGEIKVNLDPQEE